MSNVIADRVAYFLKDFPPFSFLSVEEREQVADKITVQFYQPGQFVFQEGESGKGFCYVLHKGNIKLLKKKDASDLLVDQCEPGDIFGVRSLLSGNPYVMSARVEDESLVYAIDQQLFDRFMKTNQQFSLFFASGYASGQVIVRSDQPQNRKSLSLTASFEQETLKYTQEVVTCDQQQTIKEVAAKMKANRVGSVIITDINQLPIGIVTDTDLRNKVVAEGLRVDHSITEIMSSPVKTVSPQVTVGEAMGRMITQKVHHLVVTKDGTNQTPIAGIISDHDIMLSQKSHPAALIKEIKRSEEISKWAEIRNEAELLIQKYLEQEVSITLINGLINAINELIIDKAVSQAVNKLPGQVKPDFCWILLGSEGRGEQLLRTDQDNALILGDDQKSFRHDFLVMARFVNDVLSSCGFAYCPAEIMARNPLNCLTLSEWKDRFNRWIETPDPKSLMNATIFFDFKAGPGDQQLVKSLENHLISQLKKHTIFLNHLAANALQNPPPLSFFKGFVVERSGEHKDEFDIKKRAMMPLSDAARLLTLSQGIVHLKNTVDRFNALAELEPKNAALYHDSAQAYSILMRHRAQSGLRNKDSGRFVKVESLNKLQRQMLKNAFLPIKELQELISVRFQLSYFS